MPAAASIAEPNDQDRALHIMQLSSPPRYMQYTAPQNTFRVWLTARAQSTIGLKVPVKRDYFSAGGVPILDKLALGAVRYRCLGGRGVTLLHNVLGEFARVKLGFVVAPIEHLAQLARADLTLGRNGRHA